MRPPGLLFRLEHNRGIEETRQLVQTIIALTQDDIYTELRLALGEWLRYVLLPRALPEVDLIHAPVTLTEITDMMTEHSRSWTHQWRQEGRQEGEGAMLARLLAHKYGPLSEEVTQRLRQATIAQLETWSLNILDADVLEDVFRE
ncbi:DUF4351 domain-containing protein [Pollutimonas bauzanensis]|uniref:DUF4351 domain-containing protein n=1 Tax=Pollutimonas bauzanensis TaxID=658167 RepID=A0A1M5ZTG9_9BURK|nr:DUF4351 domain-containing protein [Pollutimonas bauzanensis]SHI27595.1 protein of unknown function [Pollutimonas bauzanensis]